MLNAGHTGFTNAPVTKVLICGVVLTTVLGSIIESHARLTLYRPLIVQRYQLWRLATHHFVFTTPGELLFGLLLLYHLRLFERQLGSSKLSCLLVLCASLHTLFLVLYLSSDATIIPPSPGPYAAVLLFLIFFAAEVPRLYHFRIARSLTLSDKSLFYLVFAQFVAAYPPRSLVSTASALLAAVLCRLPFVARAADWPQPIVTLCSTYILPMLNTSPAHLSPAQLASINARRQRAANRYARVTAAVNGLLEAGIRQQELQRQRRQQQTQQQTQHQRTTDEFDHAPDVDVDDDDDAQIHHVSVVSAQHVDTLVSMGFQRDDAVSALRQAHNDLHTATELLLRTPSSD